MGWSAARGRGWLPVVARVEWRAEGRGGERPGALMLGGRRVPVTVEASWVEGAVPAGAPHRRCFLVREIEGGRFFRVERTNERERVEVFVRAPVGGGGPAALPPPCPGRGPG